MTQHPQYPQSFQPVPPPKKKHTLRTVLIVVGALFGLLLVIGLLSPSEPTTAPVQSSPAVTTPVDNGSTPDPITTPTNIPSVVPSPAPKPTKVAPKLTAGQEQAIGAAENYLSFSAFSRKGLIHQLSSDAGDGFSVADATYAVDHVEVNWNEQAVKAAKTYLGMMHFSRSGLIHQLESDAGDGFTHKQAVYGVTKAGL